MWAFLSRRLRQWLLLAVAVPIGARLLEQLGIQLEQKRGRSTISDGLRRSGEWLQNLGPGRHQRRRGHT